MKFALFALLVFSIFPSGSILAKGDVIELPFEFIEGHILLSVMVNGHGPYRMILDTGANVCVIDLPKAKEENLKLGRNAGAYFPFFGGGKFSSFPSRITRLTLGALTVTDMDVFAVDLSKTLKVDGILGYSFLKGHVVQIDYQNRLLRLYPKVLVFDESGKSNTSRYAVLPFKLKNGGISFDIQVNGHAAIAAIDTGAAATLLFSPQALTRLGLPEAKTVINVIPSNDNRRVVRITPQTKVQEIAIGTIVLESPQAEVAKQFPDSPSWDVNIGSEFLRDYVITIDYFRKKLLLERRS